MLDGGSLQSVDILYIVRVQVETITLSNLAKRLAERKASSADTNGHATFDNRLHTET